VFELLKQNFIRIRIHAGEADGPTSIYNAVLNCHATRIGHGLYLFNTDTEDLKGMPNKEEYVAKIMSYMQHTRTTIEVNLTSNS